MHYEQLYKIILSKLEKEVPAHFVYHNAQHTKSVVERVEYLAGKEKVTGDLLTILKTAALLHDAGYIINRQNHEEISCTMAREILPAHAFSAEQIERVCALILATRVPQKPFDLLSQILCDADLYYLGTDLYEPDAEKLFHEFKHVGKIKTREEWKHLQIEFLKSHTFFTSSAKKDCDATKALNLTKLMNTPVRAAREPKEKLIAHTQDILLILSGVLFAGLALKGFLVPNHFFDGGVTGISLLIHELYHINLAIVITVLNLPLILVSYYSVGKRFAYLTFISVILLGICLFLLPDFALTSDKLLISIFGGVFLGIGVGLVMRAGAALDGIEVFALYTLKKTSFTITEVIMGLNVMIFIVAAWSFGVETALYSILTYFAATRSIDYVVEGLQAYTGVTIISAKSEEIKHQLVLRLGRAITVYKGERGFLPGSFHISNEVDIIFTVITRLELRKLKNLVAEVDPNAFVFASTIKEASGGVIKRRQSH